MKYSIRYWLKWSLILCLTVLSALISGCGGTTEVQNSAVPETTVVTVTEPKRQVREGIQTLLVGCFDEFEATGFQNGKRADFLMLLIIDEKQEKTMALQINPECVVPFVPMGKTEPEQMQLGLVYTYGSGGSDSQINGRKAVSGLLGDVPIDHYMTFTKDAIPLVNDMLGGVEVMVTEDFAHAYPDFVAGETVRLQGDVAGEFFFYRDEADLDKNDQMVRQHRYMRGMFVPFTAAAQQEDFLTRLTLQLGERFDTDLTISQMVPMLELLGIYELEDQVLTIPGEARHVSDQVQFYADAEALTKLVEELFY